MSDAIGFLSDEELGDLEIKLSATTSGRWRAAPSIEERWLDQGTRVVSKDGGGYVYPSVDKTDLANEHQFVRMEDAEFVAAAHNCMARLIHEVRDARKHQTVFVSGGSKWLT